jgi:hypothetical protein
VQCRHRGIDAREVASRLIPSDSGTWRRSPDGALAPESPTLRRFRSAHRFGPGDAAFICSASCVGARPNKRLNSRLNREGLSEPTRAAAAAAVNPARITVVADGDGIAALAAHG